MANKLTLNTTKTEFMIIGSRHNLAKIKKDPIISIREKKYNVCGKLKVWGSLYRVYKKKLNKFEIALNVAKRPKV